MSSLNRATRRFEGGAVQLVGDGDPFHVAKGTSFFVCSVVNATIEQTFGHRENTKNVTFQDFYPGKFFLCLLELLDRRF